MLTERFRFTAVLAPSADVWIGVTGEGKMPAVQSLFVFLFIIILAAAAPELALPLIVVSLLAQMSLAGLQLFASLSRQELSPPRQTAARTGAIRFSVHVATHSEPPELVIRTLEALGRQQDAPPFEVIVLDNNTADPTLWRPVEAFCNHAGPHFRFFHEEGVKGAKAGALNLALARTDPRASHVVIIDADYEVIPEFLSISAQEICAQDDDFLQFPQAYRGGEGPLAGVSLELADYFLRHARQADRARAMLLTGTLSVIRRSALTAAGGWSSRTITEDAELGLRLHRLGFRGRFVDRIVGRGLLPLDYAGLVSQRHRWAMGNLGTILTGLRGLGPRAKLHVASQLTAWTNLGLPFAGVLLGGSFALVGRDGSQAEVLTTSLAGIGLLLVYVTAGLPVLVSAVGSGRAGAMTILTALCARFALIPPSALGSMDALLGLRGAFVRTPKSLSSRSGKADGALTVLAVAGVLVLIFAEITPAIAMGALLLILPLPLAALTGARLVAYRQTLLSEEAMT